MEKDAIDLADKEVEEIIQECLKEIKKGLDIKGISGIAKAKAAGEALKALADGMESYHGITKTLRYDLEHP